MISELYAEKLKDAILSSNMYKKYEAFSLIENEIDDDSIDKIKNGINIKFPIVYHLKGYNQLRIKPKKELLITYNNVVCNHADYEYEIEARKKILNERMMEVYNKITDDNIFDGGGE